MRYTRTVLGALIAGTLGLVGCGGDGDSSSSSTTGGTGGNGSGGTQAGLQTFDDDEAFYAEVRAGLVAQQSAGPLVSNGAGGEGGGVSSIPVAGVIATGSMQEAGVNEADRVKTDGERLYILHTDLVGRELLPGEELPDDGTGGTPLIYEERTSLRIVGIDQSGADATPLAELQLDYPGGDFGGLYLHQDSAGTSIIIPLAAAARYWQDWDDSAAFAGRSSGMIRVDVSDPEQPRIANSLRIDGEIVATRQVGKYLYAASRFYPSFDDIVPNEASPEEWESYVGQTVNTDLVPTVVDESNGEPLALAQPTRCFSSARPADGYVAADILTVSAFDIESMTLVDSECYLGASETMYMSENAVYIASTRWPYVGGGGGGDPSVNAPVFIDPDAVDPRIDTDLHRFSVSNGNLEYTGSGTVAGHLGWNELRRPSRLSERDGTLRVVSFAPDQAAADSPMIVSLLDVTGSGELPVVGSLPGSDRPAALGAPGVELYASRFVGDRLYLVSSRAGDALQIVDLTTASAPVYSGSLATSGLIDQLFPLDAGYLLGIGQDASSTDGVDVSTDGVDVSTGGPDDGGAPGGIGNDGTGTGADSSSGITVSLLNVSDPSAPVEVQAVNIGSNGATAAATNDPRAVTIQPANEAHPWRVAFGVEMTDGDDPLPLAGDTSATASPFDEPGLHGFDVRTGTDARIDPIGVIGTAIAGPPQVGVDYADRSVIIDNGVFYVHGSAVYASSWDGMANAVGPK